MYAEMTFALPCGVFSSRISEGIRRANWLNDRTIAMTLGARESYVSAGDKRQSSLNEHRGNKLSMYLYTGRIGVCKMDESI